MVLDINDSDGHYPTCNGTLMNQQWTSKEWSTSKKDVLAFLYSLPKIFFVQLFSKNFYLLTTKWVFKGWAIKQSLKTKNKKEAA